MSIPNICIDLAMVRLSFLEYRSRSLHRAPLAHMAAWIILLFSDLAEIALDIGLVFMDKCGGVPTYHGGTGSTAGSLDYVWLPDCILHKLDLTQASLAFIPLPYFPLSYMKLVLQLQLKHPRWQHRIVVLGDAVTVLSMLIQVTTRLSTAAFAANHALPISWTMSLVSSCAYMVHLASVLVAGGFSIHFSLRFLRITTARLGDLTADHSRATVGSTANGVSFQSLPSPLLMAGIQSTKSSTIARVLSPTAAASAAAAAAVTTHVAEFRQTATRMRHAAYASTATLALIITVVAVDRITADIPQMIVQPLITFLGRILLGLYCWSMSHLRPLMILRRKLPNVDAGTLASTWTVSQPASQVADGENVGRGSSDALAQFKMLDPKIRVVGPP
ncbi:hypothetical protein BC828DRAFT_407862 [Blastocladiella britannica]|nr:hypothetical protein BC828DRAFT_407862 [Blastocladiella britannica]